MKRKPLSRYSNSLKVFLKVACRGRKDPTLERTAEKGCWVELIGNRIFAEEKIHKKLAPGSGKDRSVELGIRYFGRDDKYEQISSKSQAAK
jgi:hypothetical protein